MAKLFSQLAYEPRSLTEELFARPEHLTLFVSSKMAGGVYVVERERCAYAVEGTGIARAWYWERDANAGPYCSESICLGRAAAADGLIVILGDELTPITRQEYEVARARDVPTFIFIDERATQDAGARAFVWAERGHSVTKNFRNVSELQTHVVDALKHFAVQSWRRTTYATWRRRRRGRWRASRR
jgi:hypothetical protein